MKTKPAFRVLAILLILASLGTLFLSWVRDFAGRARYFDWIEIIWRQADRSGFLDAVTREGNLIFSVVTAVLILTALLGLILAAAGVRGGGVPYFLATLFCLITVLYAKDWDPAVIGPGGWLCPGLALTAMLLLFISKRPAPQPVRVGAALERPAKPAAPAWACARCGTLLADGEVFCPNCGQSRTETVQPRRCRVCGAALENELGFCGNCGAPVSGATVAAGEAAEKEREK